MDAASQAAWLDGGNEPTPSAVDLTPTSSFRTKLTQLAQDREERTRERIGTQTKYATKFPRSGGMRDTKEGPKLTRASGAG